ncbi:MAG: DEAD/DEAH box helicase [Deltaproteobacteria bacterium]|nr:DEAD/DEAH box helicase [Deltaproteobacteria bacterium]
MKFDSLNLHADILRGVADAGFERCTPIQEQALPECLAGKDLIAQSQTGTGKTAVFVLAIYNRLSTNGGPSSKPKALVMVPTRELAVQVEQDAKKLGRHLPFRSIAVYGGVEYDKQISALKNGVDLVVATPGRMIDLYKSKALSLDEIDTFVIDEADRMFDMGFAPDITYIASRLPKDKPRQTMLFSATIDSNVERLASRYMKPETVRIEIEPEQVTVDAIDQKVVYVSNEEKLPVLMGILKRPDAERVIIFTNMKRTAEMLEWKLKGNGLPAKALTGDMTQSKRQKVIDGMKSGAIKMLVATDVAARGLHIEGVTHVINYDLPEEAANYVHRVGRTARAGKTGKAYSLVCESYALNLPEIEKYIERKIESEWIDEAEMVKDASGRYERERKPRAGAGGAKSGRHKAAGKPAGDAGRRAPARAPEKEKDKAVERTAGDAERIERRRTPEKDKLDERPGRILRPERPRRQRPPLPPLIETRGVEETETPAAVESAPVSEGAEGKEAPSVRPRRRRRRRRGGAGKGPEAGQQAVAVSPEAAPQAGGVVEPPERRGPDKRRRRRPTRGRGEKPQAAEGRLDYYKQKYGEEFKGEAPSKVSEKLQEKIDRHLNPSERSATPKPPKPVVAQPPKAPVEEKSGGLLKKFLGVFKKKA